jgi:hypothetical protein
MATRETTLLKGKNKATPKTIEVILEAISQGLTQREASILAGISEDTLSLWKKKDSDFSEQMRQKEIECKLSHIKNIKEASKKSWQASAWWLERKYKEEFSLKSKLDLQVNETLDELGDSIKKILTPAK